MENFKHWIPVDRIEPLLTLEPFLVAFVLAGTGWIFYKLALKRIHERRHRSLRRRFGRFTYNFAGAVISAATYGALTTVSPKLSAYASLISILFGTYALIRLAQIYLYLGLFWKNMSVGVPRVIANSFTLVFAFGLISWLLAALFEIRLAPLLATSAIFSIVLGLALQDTLGNLFSGIAMQVEKPFQIGDWIEVQTASQKVTGQIQEINWRATLLMGFSDELFSIPNKTMAQSQVTLYSYSQRPARRNCVFVFAYATRVAHAKKILLDVAQSTPGVLSDPAPKVLNLATSENGYTLKLFYSIEDFGKQYSIADLIHTNVLDSLATQSLRLASHEIRVDGLSQDAT